jgi:SAM-dependent methyltransferase
MSRRVLYVAAEKDPLHLHALRNRFLRTPNVVVQRVDPEIPGDLAELENCFDTVLCLNVLEHLEDPDTVLNALAATLRPGGAMVVLVPNVPGVFGTLDRSLGHRRRYSRASIRELLGAHGFSLESVESLNRIALVPWWAYGKIFHAGNITKLVLKIFDKSVWFWRRLDPMIPWPGLSLVVVARKPAAGEPATSHRTRREIAHNAD